MFDGEHMPLATLPGMRDRTRHHLVGRQDVLVHRLEDRLGVRSRRTLVAAVRTVKQFLTYVNGGAVPVRRSRSASGCPTTAIPTRSPPSSREKRDRLSAASPTPGSPCCPSAGTYFVTADIRSLGEHDGLAFCRSLPERCGVVAVPNVVFYDDTDAGLPLVRFAFCKRLDVIDEAVDRARRVCAR